MRDLRGPAGICIALWAVLATVFQLYTASIGFMEPREQRSLHVLLFLSLTFFLYPARPGKSPAHRPSIFDLLFAVSAIAACFYSYWYAHDINMRFEGIDPVTPVQLVLGSAITVLVIEAIRRAVTPVLAGLAMLIMFYLFTAQYWPGIFGYREIPYWEIVDIMYLRNGTGVFGTLTGIATTMVAIFIAFGAFVEGLGLGTLFNNLGSRIAGRQVGGPAKVAVITSAFFGTMSGSSSANVFTTGSFTIPMMKRLGYARTFAGGVETAASVGGQLMPPIMGAGAFVMAEITRIPYIEIVQAAALGAVCYFFMLLVSVHLEARRLGLRGMNKDEVPLWRDIVRDLHLLLPVVVLLVLLIMRFSPHYSAFWSIMSTIAVGFLRRHTWPTPRKLFNILVTAGYNTTIVSVACVGAGIIVAGLTVTGLSTSIGTVISTLSGGVLLIAGALMMVTTILLGMGLPTTAAYVITSAIGVPFLVNEFGVPVLAAHMFIFYFAILADATPPVSIASYAAAAIAKAPPIATGAQGFRMAVAGFIIGFSFLYTPSLLMQGSVAEIVQQLAINLMGLTLLASGLSGFFRHRLGWPLRIALIVCGPALALTEGVSLPARLAAAAAILAVLFVMPMLMKVDTGPEEALPDDRQRAPNES